MLRLIAKLGELIPIIVVMTLASPIVDPPDRLILDHLRKINVVGPAIKLAPDIAIRAANQVIAVERLT